MGCFIGLWGQFKFLVVGFVEVGLAAEAVKQQLF